MGFPARTPHAGPAACGSRAQAHAINEGTYPQPPPPPTTATTTTHPHIHTHARARVHCFRPFKTSEPPFTSSERVKIILNIRKMKFFAACDVDGLVEGGAGLAPLNEVGTRASARQ